MSCVTLQVGPELAAAGEVRQRRADRRDRRGDPLGDDRRADDRRHDQHVIAHADAAVGPAVARGTPALRAVIVAARDGAAARGRSPRPRALATLCVCTCAPAAMSADRRADRAAVLDDRLARANRAQRDLVPARNRFAHAITVDAPACSSRPASSGSSAVATLSRALMTSTGVHWLTPLAGSRRRRRSAGR